MAGMQHLNAAPLRLVSGLHPAHNTRNALISRLAPVPQLSGSRGSSLEIATIHGSQTRHRCARSPPKQTGARRRPEPNGSKPSLSEEGSEGIMDDSFGFTLCLVVITLALLIGTVILYFDFGAKEAPTFSPVLPKFRDFEGPESLRKRTWQPVLAPELEEGATTRRPGDTYQVRFAHRPSAARFPWMEGCTTPPCLAIRHRLLSTIREQMNPCSDLNIFTCDVRPPSVLAARQAGDNEKDNVGKQSPYYNAPYAVAHSLPRTHPQELPLKPTMTFLCGQYGYNPNADLNEVQAFTGYFKLNLWELKEDPAEDAVVRMLQLSLEYGLHPIVSFVRQFRFTRDPSEPFELQINIADRARLFFKEWDVQRWSKFYSILRLYDVNNSKPLEDGDKEVAEVFQQEVDGVSNETYEDILEPMKIDALENYTEGNLTAARWKELLVEYGRSQFELYDEVHANRRALALLGHFSRGDPLSMRRLLSWHLTLLLLAPKSTNIAMMNLVLNDTDGFQQITAEGVCEKMADDALLFPGGVMNIDHPEYRIPVERLLKVGSMVAALMETLSSITRPAPSRAQNRTNLGLALEYPASARTAGSIYYHAGTNVFNQHFLYLWLTELRTRHVQPPLVQAAFEALRRAGDSPRRLFRRFRPPYFYDGGLDSYNYATLGQLLAQGAVQELASGATPEAAEERRRWFTFWEKRISAGFNTAYCVQASTAKVTHERPVAPLNESSLRGTQLQHSMASRLAYLTWERLPGSSKERLPDLFLAPKVLFFLQHCALGCARGGPLGTGGLEDRCAVLMRGWGAIGENISCQHKELREDLTRCRHL